MEILPVFNHDALTISYERKNALVLVVWQPESTNISPEFFKEMNLKYVELAEKMPVRSFFLDTVNFFFPIEPSLQTWVADCILPKIADAGCQKIAFLTSEDFVAQLSVEQTMEERDDMPFQVRYFSNENEAFSWLKNA
jgi:hypothetical protein